MDFQYDTDRLVLKIEHQNCSEKVLQFYQKNRAFFDAWELTRADNFFSEPYHRAALRLEYDEIVKKHFLRFWIYEKEAYYSNPTDAPIIGSVSLSNIRHSCFYSAMFGYKLDHDYWGRGYAFEFCRQMLSIAFKELNLHRLEAYIMPANERSIMLIERLGFFFEGMDRECMEVNHKFENHLRYAILNDFDLQ